MILRLTAVLVLSLTLVGCFSSVRVRRSASLSANPHGIPFYAKTSVCKQQTVWLEPQYILGYEAKSGNDSSGLVEKVLNRENYLRKTVQDFIATPGSRSEWKEKVFDLPSPTSTSESDETGIKREEADGNWIRASNTGAVQTVVDYGNVFYLNSARPLAGSTQVSAKLALDGTLTEGLAQVQDQTLQTIVSTISSLVGSATTAAKTFGLEAQGEFKLTVKTKIYSHTHWQYPAPSNPAKPEKPASPTTCAALSDGVYGGSFTVAEAPDSANAKPTSADKDNTISISGSIVLPKSTVPATTPPPAPSTPPTTPPK